MARRSTKRNQKVKKVTGKDRGRLLHRLDHLGENQGLRWPDEFRGLQDENPLLLGDYPRPPGENPGPPKFQDPPGESQGPQDGFQDPLGESPGPQDEFQDPQDESQDPPNDPLDRFQDHPDEFQDPLDGYQSHQYLDEYQGHQYLDEYQGRQYLDGYQGLRGRGARLGPQWCGVSPPGVRGPLGGLGEKEVAQEAAPGAEIGWLRRIMSFE